MHCVYAGLEPLAFTNHFPHWEVNEEATNANTEENRPSRLEDMQSCFTQLSKSVYTFEELQQRPLPDGVNPNKLETYLSDEQFMVRLQFHCYLRRHSCSNYAVGYIHRHIITIICLWLYHSTCHPYIQIPDTTCPQARHWNSTFSACSE